jgi:hypothetical protein
MKGRAVTLFVIVAPVIGLMAGLVPARRRLDRTHPGRAWR